MGTQLRLVDAPETQARPARPRRANAGRRGRQAQPVRRGRRAVHWPDWQLDDRARHVGRAGVAQARAALARAQNPDPEAPLPKAS